MLNLCAFLGLIVNFHKSNLVPTWDFVVLSIQFQTVPYVCHPLWDRWFRLQVSICLFKESAPTARQWMRLTSTLMSMDSQVPLGQLHCIPIQFSFRDCWDHKRRSLTQRVVPVLLIDQIILNC